MIDDQAHAPQDMQNWLTQILSEATRALKARGTPQVMASTQAAGSWMSVEVLHQSVRPATQAVMVSSQARASAATLTRPMQASQLGTEVYIGNVIKNLPKNCLFVETAVLLGQSFLLLWIDLP